MKIKKCLLKKLNLKIKNVFQVQNKLAGKQKNYANIFKKIHKEHIKNNKLILKSKKIFSSEKHNLLTEEINKIALSPNDNKRIKSTNLIETYAYGRNNELVSKKEEIKM